MKYLETVIYFTIRQNMDFVMATPTESNTIRNFYPKFRGIFPGLNVMDNCLILFRNILTTVLAYFIISSKANITPLNILPVIKLSLWVKNRLGSLSGTLLRGIRLIRTTSRAVFTLLVILVNPKRFSTSFAISIKSCFLHGIMVTWRPI